MNRSLILATCFFLSLSGLFAMQSLNGSYLLNGDTFGFSIEPSFGYIYGQAREIVYDTSNSSTGGESSSKGDYISELIWDLSDLFYTGVSFSANFNNRIYFNGGVWTAINEGTGHMNDYDWVYYNTFDGRPYYLHDRNDKTDLSHWSLSEVDIVSSLMTDFNLSYDFISRRTWAFSAILGYKYINWEWSDIVLDSFYDGSDDAITTNVNAIDYTLSLSIPYVGLGGRFSSLKGFFFQGRIIYSPFVIGHDHDHHIFRTEFGPDGAHFYDYIYFGQYLSAILKSGYRFSDLFQLSAQISGDYLFEQKGIVYTYDTFSGDESLYSISAGGAGLQYQSLSFSINASFSF